jgi:hypothetical protein
MIDRVIKTRRTLPILPRWTLKPIRKRFGLQALFDASASDPDGKMV